MGSFDVDIRNLLDKLKLTIESEKNSSYAKSIELANKIYNKIGYNSTNSGDGSNLYLEKLLNLSIIMKDYPKRIIIKGTRSQRGIKFDASIMCLLNQNTINFFGVDIKPFMCSPNGVEGNLCFPISLSEPTVSTTNQSCWNLKNMRYQTTDSTRSSKRSTYYKSIIKFEFKAKYNLEHPFYYTSQSISAELLSETVVVIVHSNQEVDSLLTLFWDDYYRIDRSSNSNLFDFRCDIDSSFQILVDNLSSYFFQETNRHLTERNKNYLVEKLRSLLPSREFITFDMFMKQIMPSSKLSFGQWIMSIIKMLKIQTLEKMWQNDFIEGFISKDADGVSLPPGSFILRFSERQAAIGVLCMSPENKLNPWDPYTDSHLRSNNLANLLNEYSYCLDSMMDTIGNNYPTRDVLKRFMENECIEEGYTDRGIPNPFSSLDQNQTFNDNDYESQDIENLDLTEISMYCDELINSYEETEQDFNFSCLE